MSNRPIEHYEVLPAGVKPYDPRAPKVADVIGTMITDRIPGTRFEHIGSTAVPGCEGKGYIDLLIPFDSEAQREQIKAVLADLGFQPQATKVVFPETRPMRTGVYTYDGHRYPIHVHVVPAEGEELKALLLFRDRLRADPELMHAYTAKKRAIVEAGITESPDYAVAKGDFVQAALLPPKE
jgi:GrpB-like predicted nucleotidyltransferase (UPF0157 family)